MRAVALSPILLILHVCTALGEDVRSDFLSSNDPRWDACLAEKRVFPSAELSVREFTSKLHVPHALLMTDGTFETRIVQLPSTEVDLKTALRELYRQTGADIRLSGTENSAFAGTISIAPKGGLPVPVLRSVNLYCDAKLLPSSESAKLRDWLEGNGIGFPPGSSVEYDSRQSALKLRNTQEHIAIVQELLEHLGNSEPSHPANREGR